MKQSEPQSRKGRILQCVLIQSKGISCAQDLVLRCREFALDAAAIMGQTGIDRSNVSRELNALCREAQLIRIKGKPVLFLLRSAVMPYLDLIPDDGCFENMEMFIELVVGADNASDEEREGETVFDALIGAKQSLRCQVELAKAAMQYPPNGLHTIILGATGVGKSIFAETMYKYAQSIHRFTADTPFVVFNCADYSNNSSLLISHLFGYVKGAFTGADKDKDGLIDYANNGVLFLDEVHRLPPEGQEMLFLVIDKGRYRRLGETKYERKATVQLIAATTENAESVMLRTFLRRIPVTIDIPELNKRSQEERIALIKTFFAEEALRINRSIHVSKNALRALANYKCEGNIGQLKSDIQLLCAKALIKSMANAQEDITIESCNVVSTIREGLACYRFNPAADNHEIKALPFGATFSPQNAKSSQLLIRNLSPQDYKYQLDYFNNISTTWAHYGSRGLDTEEIIRKTTKKLEEYLSDFYSEIDASVSSSKSNVISEIVGDEIYNAVSDVLTSKCELFSKRIIDQLTLGISVHMSNYIKRNRTDTMIKSFSNVAVKAEFPTEYAIAYRILVELEERLTTEIPESEAALIAMMLNAATNTGNTPHIGVLVIAHGKTTASSMVDAAHELLKLDCGMALDMPLTQSIDEMLEHATEIVSQLDQSKGVLILCDMGSLSRIGALITDRTNIPVVVLNNVSTLMVSEAIRKSIIPGMTLEQLAFETTQTIQPPDTIPDLDPDSTDELTIDYLMERMPHLIRKVLVYLDPQKACAALSVVLNSILDMSGLTPDSGLLIKFMFHNSGMIERQLRGFTMKNCNTENYMSSQKRTFGMIKKAFEYVEDTFGFKMQNEEIAGNLELLELHYGIKINL